MTRTFGPCPGAHFAQKLCIIFVHFAILTYVFFYGTIDLPKNERVLNMSKTKTQLHNEIRANFMSIIGKSLNDGGYETLLTNSNEYAIPCTDEEGNEEFLVLTFKVPTGSRDGEPYDGYSLAESYALKVADKEAKAKASAEAKAKKIAKDKAMREAKAKAKAEREAKGE